MSWWFFSCETEPPGRSVESPHKPGDRTTQGPGELLSRFCLSVLLVPRVLVRIMWGTTRGNHKEEPPGTLPRSTHPTFNPSRWPAVATLGGSEVVRRNEDENEDEATVFWVNQSWG